MTPNRYQHRRMHALWKVAQITDRVDRLRLTSAVVGRQLSSSNDITETEADQVIDYMASIDDEGPGALAVKAARWLSTQRGPTDTPGPAGQSCAVGDSSVRVPPSSSE